MLPLALLNEGDIAEIVGCFDDKNRFFIEGMPRGLFRRGRGRHGWQYTNYLQSMGLRPGKQIEMINNGGQGPLVFRVDESRIALGRGAAMKIYVRRIQK
ncbi:MAG: ferrous iron transport protein A [Syntrophaceae bacterium]|nr:ferrous iron transport protein A [Syntrophaceae bacterium]